MYYANKYGLLPADRIIEPIFVTGLSKHHAIYLGADNAGTEWIAENYKFRDVRLVTAAAYFARLQPFKVKKFAGSPTERKQAVQRALQEIGKPYDLINYNCEHFAEYVQHGRAASRQIEMVKEGLGVAALVLLFIGTVKLLSND